MPELAEVAYACKTWRPGLGMEVSQAICHPKSRVFRDLDQDTLARFLSGATLRSSQSHGKQMLFGFSTGWLGLHLGMTGSLTLEDAGYEPAKHDALVLKQSQQTLVFNDPRQFGKLTWDDCGEVPGWWANLPPLMTSPEFSIDLLGTALSKHKRQPIKALLLDQRYFPGMGNWMADEVLWRAGIHPAQLAGQIPPKGQKSLYGQAVFVAQGVMDTVGKRGGDPPDDWLFHARWKDGQTCPKSGITLVREKIGGRTTCWSPTLQPIP